MADQDRDLSRIIANEIKAKGPIPFARYMELCLYHPILGYYQRQEPITGPSGDFYTAPHVHSLFGRTIGAWLSDLAGRYGLSDLTVLELGPGNGQLARDILDSWSKKGPAISFILVEEAGPRRRDLEARFADDPVSIISPDDVDDLESFEGAVLANEFFDALPLRVFTRVQNQLKEVYVDHGAEGFMEVLHPVEVDGPAGEILEVLPEDFRTEFSDLWELWLKRIFRVLARGRLLVLDYGETTDGLIVPWRVGGSLRCYRRHQVDTDPYGSPGEKDITAHVNFTLLRRFSEEAGMKFLSLSSQSSFLIKGGILEMLARSMEDLPEKEATGLWLTVKNLIHEEGMGEIFKAMILSKGV